MSTININSKLFLPDQIPTVSLFTLVFLWPHLLYFEVHLWIRQPVR